MNKTKYLFGDIVVVDNVKAWLGKPYGTREHHHYEIYVRNYHEIREYAEPDVERYRIRHKELDEQELEWQSNP